MTSVVVAAAVSEHPPGVACSSNIATGSLRPAHPSGKQACAANARFRLLACHQSLIPYAGRNLPVHQPSWLAEALSSRLSCSLVGDSADEPPDRAPCRNRIPGILLSQNPLTMTADPPLLVQLVSVRAPPFSTAADAGSPDTIAGRVAPVRQTDPQPALTRKGLSSLQKSRAPGSRAGIRRAICRHSFAVRWAFGGTVALPFRSVRTAAEHLPAWHR